MNYILIILIFIILLICLLSLRILKEVNNFTNDDDFGFIIIRHVNSELTNKYWINNVKNIRKYYNNKIIIIDDNSDKKYLENLDVSLENCEIIKSEFPKRGEQLPYYYLYKNKYFKKAVIIHDSLFINKHIDFNYDKCIFLFHFERFKWDNKELIISFLKYLNNSDYLIERYLDINNENMWYGCFGAMSFITLDFLTLLQDKYNLFKLIDYIDSRDKRMCFERIFGLLCCIENPELKNKPSIFGSIHSYIPWEYTYDNYLNETDKNILNLPVIKVWSGR